MKHLFNQFIIKIIQYLPIYFVQLVAQRYVAGESIDDALNVVREINNKGYSATVDILGEHTNSISSSHEITKDYKNLIYNIHKQNLNCNISIKPSHIGMNISKDCIFENITNLIETARQYGQFIRIDMEDSSLTDDTIRLFNDCKNNYSHIGTVLQAYLFRSENDLTKLKHFKNVNLRICKGIYRESSDIAIQNRHDINNNFLKLIRSAFENNIYVGIATHDLSLISETYNIIEELGISKDRFEFQVLYGVPMGGWLEKHIKHGYKIRVYVPFGKDWYDYSLRRIKENPDIAGYIIKDIFRK